MRSSYIIDLQNLKNLSRKVSICLTNFLAKLNPYLFITHYVKSAHIRSFCGPYFPAFGVNTQRYGVSLCIQSECGKRVTRETLNTDTFHVVTIFENFRPGLDFNDDSLKIVNPLTANPTKWSNTLKQFVGNLPTNFLSVFDLLLYWRLKG